MSGYKGINNTGTAGGLGYIPEDIANKSTNANLGTSDVLYPTQRAVKQYVDLHSGGGGGVTPEVKNVTVNLGDEQNEVTTTILDSWADNAFHFSAIVSSEELLLQSVSFYITNIINGVSYDIVAICPNGASGQHQITIKKEVLNVG